MSKFFEALQQAEWDQARQTQASLAPARVGLLEALPPAAPLEEAPPRVLGTAQTVTEVAVDRSDRVDEHLVSLVSPGAFEATEQYRVLRHIVETLRKSANLQVVAITSPGVGEGKTSTAINLAGALAQSAAARVLLMDIDLRRPAVARQLGLAGSKRGFRRRKDPGRIESGKTKQHAQRQAQRAENDATDLSAIPGWLSKRPVQPDAQQA